MHPRSRGNSRHRGRPLSIPFTWDFSMHRTVGRGKNQTQIKAFNSLYLGFFHASSTFFLWVNFKSLIFQFPLLGIFPCINGMPRMKHRWCCCFQFPLLGIFPCIRRLFWLRLSITAVLI